MAATIAGPIQNLTGLPNGSSSALNLTAAQVVKAAPGILNKISCIVAGSITINDLAVNSGAGAANEIWSGSLTAGQVLELDWPCITGITVSSVTSAQLCLAFT